MVKVLGIGDVMCDKNLTTGIMYPGGQSLNIPANAKLQGQEAAFVGAFGNDFVAEHIKNTMDKLGMDYSHSRTYPVPHHCAYYNVVNNDRVFVKSPEKVHPMTRGLFAMLEYEGFTEDDWKYIEGFDVVHCSNDSHIEEMYPTFKQKGICLSFDFSVIYKEPGYMEKICPYAYFVLLSCSHMTIDETKEVLKKAYDLGARICVGTRGKKGSVCYDGKKFYLQDPDDREGIVDTMGAGDAFISAFLVSFLNDGGKKAEDKGDIIQKAMQYATLYATDACQRHGSFGFGVPFELKK